jgi:hypothetical protein
LFGKGRKKIEKMTLQTEYAKRSIELWIDSKSPSLLQLKPPGQAAPWSKP